MIRSCALRGLRIRVLKSDFVAIRLQTSNAAHIAITASGLNLLIPSLQEAYRVANGCTSHHC